MHDRAVGVGQVHAQRVVVRGPGVRDKDAVGVLLILLADELLVARDGQGLVMREPRHLHGRAVLPHRQPERRVVDVVGGIGYAQEGRGTQGGHALGQHDVRAVQPLAEREGLGIDGERSVATLDDERGETTAVVLVVVATVVTSLKGSGANGAYGAGNGDGRESRRF